jgi:hypothetical protein
VGGFPNPNDAGALAVVGDGVFAVDVDVDALSP